MSKIYQRLLYRDRHRLIVTGLLALVTGLIAAPSWPALTAGVLALALILPAIPLFTNRFRRHRFWIEVTAVGSLLFVILARLLPGSPFDFRAEGLGITHAVAWGATVFFARWLIYGHWADRFTPEGEFHAPPLQFRTSASVEDLWFGLIPFPGHLDKYAEPYVMSADWIGGRNQTIHCFSWGPDGQRVAFRFHLSDVDYLKSVGLRFELLQGPADPSMSQGCNDLSIVDHGTHRVVTMKFHGPWLAPRRMLQAFLDDTYGRMFDIRIAAIEQGPGAGGRLSNDDYLPDWFEDVPSLLPVRERLAG